MMNVSHDFKPRTNESKAVIGSLDRMRDVSVYTAEHLVRV